MKDLWLVQIMDTIPVILLFQLGLPRDLGPSQKIERKLRERSQIFQYTFKIDPHWKDPQRISPELRIPCRWKYSGLFAQSFVILILRRRLMISKRSLNLFILSFVWNRIMWRLEGQIICGLFSGLLKISFNFFKAWEIRVIMCSLQGNNDQPYKSNFFWMLICCNQSGSCLHAPNL